MKEVLISIQPKWCELIANGTKTVEVRKTKPKLNTPFKCYIYQTVGGRTNTVDILENNLGKVIGEFVCDEILQFNHDDYNSPAYDISDDDLNRTCLFQEDLYRYASGKTLYGWRTSSLRKYLNGEYLEQFNRGDLLPFVSDLTSDDGMKDYGTAENYVFLLSCDLYRKYRESVPRFNGRWLMLTPWTCSLRSSLMRAVSYNGTSDTSFANVISGVAPACLFNPKIFE